MIAAKPGPAIGQALGPLGINMAAFCKEFNEKSTEQYIKDVPLRVVLNAMSDRSFTFALRSPPTSWLIQQAAGIQRGPNQPNPLEAHGYITPEQVYHIATIKQSDENRWHLPLEGIARSVLGTAKSMGVHCVDNDDDDSVPVVDVAN